MVNYLILGVPSSWTKRFGSSVINIVKAFWAIPRIPIDGDWLEMHQVPKERADQQHIPETQPERLVHDIDAGNCFKE